MQGNNTTTSSFRKNTNRLLIVVGGCCLACLITLAIITTVFTLKARNYVNADSTAQAETATVEANLKNLLHNQGRIVFAYDNSIFRMNPDGSAVFSLMSLPSKSSINPSVSSPKWILDGEKIAFVYDGDIYVMDKNGTNLDRVYNGTIPFWSSPSWSPHDEQIAFAEECEIFIINKDGTNPLVFAPKIDDYCYSSPAWSPDGSKIAFAFYNTGGGPDIYVMNIDGTNKINLSQGYEVDSHHGVDNSKPAWSPDGKKIAFVCQGWICLINSDGTGQIDVLESQNDIWYDSLSWSKDGRWIITESTDNLGIDGFTIISSDHNGIFQTDVKGEDPDWSP
ncbi:MAG: hypothetical protein K8S20_00110 [Chloroflexi bacterium]|nr:hypothetical protein [Chloroflexota bacterium]